MLWMSEQERSPGKGYTQGISWLTPFVHHFSLICIFLIVFQWVHFCNAICILGQIIATVIFIFVSSVKNKKINAQMSINNGHTNRGWSACAPSADPHRKAQVFVLYLLLVDNFGPVNFSVMQLNKTWNMVDLICWCAGVTIAGADPGFF